MPNTRRLKGAGLPKHLLGHLQPLLAGHRPHDCYMLRAGAVLHQPARGSDGVMQFLSPTALVNGILVVGISGAHEATLAGSGGTVKRRLIK